MMSSLKNKWIEKVLFTMWSETWERDMPTTLIEYTDGKKDIHCQTGDHHGKSLARAKEIMAAQGCAVGECAFTGPSGCYYPILEVPSQIPSEA